MGYLVVIVLIILVVIFVLKKDSEQYNGPSYPTRIIEQPHERAGRIGEENAIDTFNTLLNSEDRAYKNIEISFDGHRAEIDYAVVNRNGFFVVEVKNFAGRVSGEEEDDEWTQTKTSAAGRTYFGTEKNPIRQVNRQCGIMKKHLVSCGIRRVWVEGKVWIWNAEVECDSEKILEDEEDFESWIHSPGQQPLDDNTVSRICIALEELKASRA